MFRATYSITSSGFGAAWFERQTLPFSGGAGEQPALLMQQIECLARLHNEVLQEFMKEKREEDDRQRAED